MELTTRQMTREAVLILVVVDNGLVPILSASVRVNAESLNPCCSGQWSRTVECAGFHHSSKVLILVVVDNGLVRGMKSA